MAKQKFSLLLPFATLVLLVATACTTTDEIIIDTKGVNMASYDTDLAECREYSDQVAVGEKAAKGAASGAVVGGAIGAIVGNSSDAARGAGVGAVTGGAKGVSRGEQDKVRVVKNCLRGRGYRVLN
jgi:outer membrane lipoprotein SlyB